MTPEPIETSDKFPSTEEWMRLLEAAPPSDEDVKTERELLRRYALEGEFAFTRRTGSEGTMRAGTALIYMRSMIGVSVRHAWREVTPSTEDALQAWLQYSINDYVSLKLDIWLRYKILDDVENGKRRQYGVKSQVRDDLYTMCNLMRCGWMVEAKDIFSSVIDLTPLGVYTDNKKGALRRQTDHMIVDIASNYWQLDAPSSIFSSAEDDEIIKYAREYYLSDDPHVISNVLVLLLDRHTHQVKPAFRKPNNDFDNLWSVHDPYEVVFIMRIRELYGLENPKIEHVFMKPIVGELLEGPRPSLPEPEGPVVERIISDMGIDDPLLVA